MAYIARKNYLHSTAVVGNGQCVTLVKELTGASPSSLWREGRNVGDILRKRGEIAEGTAIATFENGHYPNRPHGNHAAIFVRAVAGGFEVFDQWKGQAPIKRILRFNRPAIDGVKRAELYAVVE